MEEFPRMFSILFYPSFTLESEDFLYRVHEKEGESERYIQR